MSDELVEVEMGAATTFYIFGAGSDTVSRQRPRGNALRVLSDPLWKALRPSLDLH